MAKRPKPKVITKKQFDRWSPEHQQRALADRRTRIRIEDAALPAEWLQKRKEARFNKTPITEGSATTYGDLARQRAYLEPLTFGEGDRQLATRTQNLAGLQQASNDWFSQYRQQIADANTAASQAAQATVQGGRDMIQGITNQSNMDRDVVARQLRDRATQLGQASTAPEFEQLANAARDTRAAQLASSNQAMNAGAAAASQEAASRVMSAGLADQANRESNQRRVAALDTDKRDYATKKDAWRAKFIEDAISEARRQVLEDKAYKIKAQTAAEAAAARRAQLAIQGKNADTTARSQQETARHNRAMENKPSGSGGRSSSGGPKPATPKETRTQAAAIRRAIVLIRGYKAQGKPTGQIRQGLAVKKIDTDVVNTAMDVVYLGGIGKVNRSRWRKAGYNPRNFGQPFK